MEVQRPGQSFAVGQISLFCILKKAASCLSPNTGFFIIKKAHRAKALAPFLHIKSSMAKIIFYEKPGCASNAKQKRILRELGHQVEEKNILETKWSKTELLKFLWGSQPFLWFNPNAPDIKSGKIDPWLFGREEAMERMIQDPILIRRPLMIIDGDKYQQGFAMDKFNLIAGENDFLHLNDSACQKKDAAVPCGGS